MLNFLNIINIYKLLNFFVTHCNKNVDNNKAMVSKTIYKVM
jgi:hypothetical protein